MRVTNMMTTNQLILNLNKSMTQLSFLQYQAETGNKIRYASDNPIIAGRSLKFRTNIVETEQYLANVDQGRSWLQSTSNAVSNVIEALSSNADNSIRTLLVNAANGTNTINDSKIFANQLRETLNEILGEFNVTYAGRYIFSGFKTDERPVFDVDEPNLKMEISQLFDLKEIDTDYRVYIKTDSLVEVDENKVADSSLLPYTGNLEDTSMPQEISIKRLKLPYDVGIDNIDIPGLALMGITLDSRNSSEDPDAYLPTENEIYFIEDTGELIFGENAYAVLNSSLDINIAKDYKSDAEATLDFFNNITSAADIAAAINAATSLKAQLEDTSVIPHQNSTVKSLAEKIQNAIDAATKIDTSSTPLDATQVKAAQNAMQTAYASIVAENKTMQLEINYDKTGFKAGELNPKVYFTCAEVLANGTRKEYNMDYQAMMYEFSINNRMQVNSLAMDILTPSFISDIKDAIDLLDNIQTSDLDDLVSKLKKPPYNMDAEEAEKFAEEQITNETKFYMDMIENKFTQLIGKIDKHSSTISLQNTSIGSRIQRLDLISNRLQDDRINFEDLKASNDYVDASEVYIRYSSMLAVYQSALQTGAKVIQMTLVNFI